MGSNPQGLGPGSEIETGETMWIFCFYLLISRVIMSAFWYKLDQKEDYNSILLLVLGGVPLIGELVLVALLLDRRDRRNYRKRHGL